MVNRVLEECRKPALAHVRRNADGSFAIHHLEDHLRAVELSSESLIRPLAVLITNVREKAEELL